MAKRIRPAATSLLSLPFAHAAHTIGALAIYLGPVVVLIGIKLFDGARNKRKNKP